MSAPYRALGRARNGLWLGGAVVASGIWVGSGGGVSAELGRSVVLEVNNGNWMNTRSVTYAGAMMGFVND
jgi:hypothetical protein